jgi:hypothetical protein
MWTERQRIFVVARIFQAKRLFGIRLRPNGMVISKPIGSQAPVEKL